MDELIRECLHLERTSLLELDDPARRRPASSLDPPGDLGTSLHRQGAIDVGNE